LEEEATSPCLWTTPFQVRLAFVTIGIDSTSGSLFCSFPYVATTLKESQEIKKLNQIWQSIPNKRMSDKGAIAKDAKACKKYCFFDREQTKNITNSMNTLIARYDEYKNNSYYLSLALSKDIYNSMKASNTPPMPNARLDLSLTESKENENTRPESKSSDSTGTSSKSTPHYRLSEGVTFAEITNKLNCVVGKNFR
jgi:hypothetical protein